MKILYIISGFFIILKDLIFSYFSKDNSTPNADITVTKKEFIFNKWVVIISGIVIGLLFSIYVSSMILIGIAVLMWFFIPLKSYNLFRIMLGIIISLFIFCAMLLYVDDTYEKVAEPTTKKYNTNSCGKLSITADYNDKSYNIRIPKECENEYVIIYKKYEAKSITDRMFNLVASCKSLDKTTIKIGE